MAIDWYDHIALLLLWLCYFSVHSLLASLAVKGWVAAHWPQWMPAYRLGYNVVAVGLLAPALWLMLSIDSPWLWHFDGLAGWVADGVALAAIVLFLATTRYYDGAEFIGLRQWRNSVTNVEDQERLKISPFHCWVRHPWYSIAIVLIWSRDMRLSGAISAVAITLYFLFGSRLEERKLLQYYGAAYARYRERVPGLLPRPWRRLTAAQAIAIEQESRHD